MIKKPQNELLKSFKVLILTAVDKSYKAIPLSPGKPLFRLPPSTPTLTSFNPGPYPET